MVADGACQGDILSFEDIGDTVTCFNTINLSILRFLCNIQPFQQSLMENTNST